MSDRLTLSTSARPVTRQLRYAVSDVDGELVAWFDDYSQLMQVWAVVGKEDTNSYMRFRYNTEAAHTMDSDIPEDWKELRYIGIQLGYVAPNVPFLLGVLAAFNREKDSATITLSCRCSESDRSRNSVCQYCQVHLRRMLSRLRDKAVYASGSNYLIPIQYGQVMVKPVTPPAYTLKLVHETSIVAAIRSLNLRVTDFKEVVLETSGFEADVLDRLYQLEGVIRSSQVLRPCQFLSVTLTRAGGRWMCFHSVDLLCYGQTPEDACKEFDKLFKEGR